MILQRLAKAIREQNWFAVALEFVIVVSGVLLAFQISEVAAARSERAHAHDTLVRVEGEIQTITEARAIAYARLTAHIELLIEARPIIMDNLSEDVLTPLQCESVVFSSRLHRSADELPSLRELIDAGAMGAIDNDALRQSVSDFLAKQNSAREFEREQFQSVDDLTELFYEIVWFELIEDPEAESGGDGWDRQAVCDLDAMRESRAFRAHILRNLEALRSMRDSFRFMDAALEDLHIAVDAELGLTHAGAE